MPDHDFVNLVVGGAIQQSLPESRWPSRAPSSAEALLSDEAGVQKMLELFGLDQVAQDAQSRFAVSSGQLLACGSMRCCSQRFCSGILDVHVLAADFAAVGLAQRLQNLAQRGHRLSPLDAAQAAR